MKLAFKWFIPITLIAMGLAWCSEQVALLLGFDPVPQDLVKLFTNPGISWTIKAKYAALTIIAAPVIEELIFRKGLFRFCIWCGRKMNGCSCADADCSPAFPMVSALISGAIFAAAHFHAATFLPLWFLGVAFAWLYWRSNTIFSPMLCHFLFNLINFVLCVTLGAEVAGKA
jgi:membrane protease YdiL (CAAX protease family)